MNPAQLLAHFDRISEAPDAIPRLRRFILDLAVRGKLVEQDPKDEPAFRLPERAEASSEGEERPFSVPASWAWLPVGAIGTSRLGKMLDRGKNKGTPRRYLRNVNVRWFDFDLSDVMEMRFEDSELEEFSLRSGDVLICEGGEPGRAAVWDERETDIYFQKAIHRVRFAEGVSPHYFADVLRQSAESGRLATHFTGVAIKHLTGRGLSAFLVPLPPLGEQHRIVAKVDELMALCDRLEASQAERESRRDRLAAASLNRLNQPPGAAGAPAFRDHARFHLSQLPRVTTRPDQLRALRQTILNLAVRGQLVPQDPNDEPAAVLHDRLRTALAREHKNDQARSRRELLPTAVAFFGDGAFPPSWAPTNFDSVNAIASGVAKGKDLRGFKTATYPYLRVANVQRGYLDLAVVKDLEIRVDELDRYRLRKGDVLMTEGGDWDKLGRAAIWNDEVPDCIHQNHIYRIRPANNCELLPEWIALFANSPLGRSYFEGASKQTTNLASINMTQLRSCPLPLPPLAEQHRIVAKVDELMALCDRLEAQLTGAQTESRRLLEAVLHHALAPVA